MLTRACDGGGIRDPLRMPMADLRAALDKARVAALRLFEEQRALCTRAVCLAWNRYKSALDPKLKEYGLPAASLRGAPPEVNAHAAGETPEWVARLASRITIHYVATGVVMVTTPRTIGGDGATGELVQHLFRVARPIRQAEAASPPVWLVYPPASLECESAGDVTTHTCPPEHPPPSVAQHRPSLAPATVDRSDACIHGDPTEQSTKDYARRAASLDAPHAMDTSNGSSTLAAAASRPPASPSNGAPADGDHAMGDGRHHARSANGTRAIDPTPGNGVTGPPHGQAASSSASSPQASAASARTAASSSLAAPRPDAAAHANFLWLRLRPNQRCDINVPDVVIPAEVLLGARSTKWATLLLVFGHTAGPPRAPAPTPASDHQDDT